MSARFYYEVRSSAYSSAYVVLLYEGGEMKGWCEVSMRLGVVLDRLKYLPYNYDWTPTRRRRYEELPIVLTAPRVNCRK